LIAKDFYNWYNPCEPHSERAHGMRGVLVAGSFGASSQINYA